MLYVATVRMLGRGLFRFVTAEGREGADFVDFIADFVAKRVDKDFAVAAGLKFAAFIADWLGDFSGFSFVEVFAVVLDKENDLFARDIAPELNARVGAFLFFHLVQFGH